MQGEDLKLAAYTGLLNGDLSPLSTALAQGALTIDPLFDELLISMINGDTDYHDYLLKTVKHPRLKRLSQGTIFKSKARLKMINIADYLIKQGIRKGGHYDAVIKEGAEKFDLSEGRIKEYWGYFLAYEKTTNQRAKELGLPVLKEHPDR